MPGGGRGAHGPWLLALVGAVLVLGLELANWSGGLPESFPAALAPSVEAVEDAGPRLLNRRPPQPPYVRFQGAGFDTWAALRGMTSLFPAHPSWCPARGRFSPDLFAVPRWSRARQAVSDTAIAHRVRCPVAFVSTGSGLADRPSIVTRPLRGPPASR